MSKYHRIDVSKLHTYHTADRQSKVDNSLFASSGAPRLSEFWACVPDILKAREMKELLAICVTAVQNGKPIYLGIGGHVIKCGLAPLLIDLMKLGVISGIASNGSVVIHDYEIAMFGKTSEDVAAALADGSFGMAADTADGINACILHAYKADLGLGEAVGKALCEGAYSAYAHDRQINSLVEQDADPAELSTQPAPFQQDRHPALQRNTDLQSPTPSPIHTQYSLLANAYRCDVPFTVHVALGTDIIHQHPTADGAAIGAASLHDFQIFCHNLIALNDGGVFLNFGSSVIIPEVFLKAIAVVRNLGYPLKDFTTAVFDMNMQYRSLVNVVQRPVLPGGKGYYFIGHHELMIPLFLLSLKELIV